MKKWILMCMVILFWMAGMEKAAAWQTPLPEWEITNGFWSCNYRCYHLGEDVMATPDTEVMAAGDGVVVEAAFRNNAGSYGGRILIQHETPEGPVVTLYGHLGQMTDDPVTNDIFVRTGDRVSEGQVIGRIGTRAENGNYATHLHFAVKPGAYRSYDDCGVWNYGGYLPSTHHDPTDTCYCRVLSSWKKPSAFLGLEPEDLQIFEFGVAPEEGIMNETVFTWELGVMPDYAPINAHVLIDNPYVDSIFAFDMEYTGELHGLETFEYEKDLLVAQTYRHKFEARSCYGYDESGWIEGPVVLESWPVEDEEDEEPEEDEEDEPEVPVCVPTAETCDGFDNDCDSVIDEELVRECEVICDSGMEAVGGTEWCVGGIWRWCDAGCAEVTEEEPEVPVIEEPEVLACAASEDVCDGLDDNCNGAIDEGIYRTCNYGCDNGIEICIDGVWGWCNALECPPPPPEDPEPDEPSCVMGWEICDGFDNDCDGQIDEGLTRSCSNGCNSGTETCSFGTWGGCNAPSCPPPPPPEEDDPPPPTCVPRTEECNNIDDDCDGLTDENVSVSCTSYCGYGVQLCVNGSFGVCDAPACPPPRCIPTPEVCDGVDNDCDGHVDQNTNQACATSCGSGMRICDSANGVLGVCEAPECPPPPPACVYSTEMCDGFDNDCDGYVDEGLTRICHNECGNTGWQGCQEGSWMPCSAQACCDVPSTEICDGVDNDCNGQIDEGLTRVCYRPCGSGTENCGNGMWINCNAPACPPPPPPPTCVYATEMCDGFDNDCDGQIDEGLTRVCSNGCNSGTQVCNYGTWGGCNAPSCPPPPPPPPVEDPPDEPDPPPPPTCVYSTEMCDGFDNDCDGQIDEGLTRVCSNGCNSGTEACNNGTWGGCDAPPCPPPPPPPDPEPLPLLPAPTPSIPGNGWIKQVSEGSSGLQLIRWLAVSGAHHYEYRISFGSLADSGSVILEGASDSIAISFPITPETQYGNRISWKARAIAPDGTPGLWSESRYFYVSHPTGSLVQCSGSACPFPGAIYLVTDEVASAPSMGVPFKLKLEWVSTECYDGSSFTSVPWIHLQHYSRSSAAGGCP